MYWSWRNFMMHCNAIAHCAVNCVRMATYICLTCYVSSLQSLYRNTLQWCILNLTWAQDLEILIQIRERGPVSAKIITENILILPGYATDLCKSTTCQLRKDCGFTQKAAWHHPLGHLCAYSDTSCAIDTAWSCIHVDTVCAFVTIWSVKVYVHGNFKVWICEKFKIVV